MRRHEFPKPPLAPFADGGPLRRRDYLDSIAWNAAHPSAALLRAVAQTMREAEQGAPSTPDARSNGANTKAAPVRRAG